MYARRCALPTTVSTINTTQHGGHTVSSTRRFVRAPSTVTRQQNATGTTGNGRWVVLRIRRVLCLNPSNPYAPVPEPQRPPPYTPEGEAPPSYSPVGAAQNNSSKDTQSASTVNELQGTSEPPPAYTQRY